MRLTAGRPLARYEVGCLYIGVNDVRSVDWNASRFSVDFRAALEFLTGRCDRVLAVTAPFDLGRPQGAARVRELNEVILRVAGSVDALVLDLRSWGARNLVMTDHVHPTAFGQIDIAERALAMLAGAGMSVAAHPSRMIFYETTWRQRLRGDVTYVYRHSKVSARAAWVALAARRRGPAA